MKMRMAIVGMGVLLSAVGAARAALDDDLVAATAQVTSSFPAGDKPRVVATDFNGAIDLTAGDGDKIEVQVEKRARAATKEEAEALLRDIHVVVEQKEGVVRVAADVDGGAGHGHREVVIHLTAPARTACDLSVTNGAVRVAGLRDAEAVLKTDDGAVSLRDCKGVETRAEVENGQIEMTDCSDMKVNAAVVNGEVRFTGALAAGDHAFTARNGRITLALPEKPGFTIDARVKRGRIAFGPALRRTDVDTARRVAGVVGDDSGVHVQASTDNGRIDVQGLEP